MHAITAHCQSLGVAMAIMVSFKLGETECALFIKYAWKIMFVSPRMATTASRTLCEPNDVGCSCDFSKNNQNVGFGTIPIGLYYIT